MYIGYNDTIALQPKKIYKDLFRMGIVLKINTMIINEPLFLLNYMNMYN